MTKLRTLLLTLAALGILPGTAARASVLNISLISPTLAAQPGQTVVFQGTVTNTTSVTVDLNGCAVNPPATLSADCTAGFFTFAPLTLAAGDNTGVIDLFSITVNPAYTGPFGRLTGDFQVTGNVEVGGVYNGDAQDLLATQSFSVTVAPEPGTITLFLIGLPAAGLLRRRFTGSKG